MNTPLIAAVVCALLAGATLAGLWATGRVGTTRVVRTGAQAREVLEALADQAAAIQRAALTTSATASDATATSISAGSTSAPTAAGVGAAERNLRRAQILDAAVPGSLALGHGICQWLTPDPAAVSALEHVTGTDIDNAFDFHRTIAEGKYELWTGGSLINWRGHVGEHQIADQIDSWAGAGTVTMPDTANYAGADLTMFGQDFQVKFGEKFSSIDNKYGDTLIVPEGTTGVPEDALTIDLSQPFDAADLEGHDVIVAEGLTLAGAEDTWAEATGFAAGGIDGDFIADAGADALLPGVGALIRVGASGYRRREALADPSIRSDAAKLVARDAAYGGGGAAIGGTIGTVVGAGVDIVTMGMSGGTGMLVLGGIGAALGGKASGDMAREQDHRRISLAHAAVSTSLTEYGTSVEAVTAEANRAWAKFMQEQDAQAAERAAVAKTELARTTAAASAELETLTHLSAADIATFAVDVTTAIITPAGGPATRRDTFLIRQLLEQIHATRTTGARVPEDAENVLEAVLRVQGTEPIVAQWLQDRLQRRSTILGALHAHQTAHTGIALGNRIQAMEGLNVFRTQLNTYAGNQLVQPIRDVEKANSAFKRELKLQG